MSEQLIDLSERHTEAMEAVISGADVYDYEAACLLREVQCYDPSLIYIGRARMYEGDGTDQMPYFGAIITEKGLDYLQERYS